MKQFKTYNCILGWVVWIIAVIVYIMTIEPTTSFWDCGEFIATAYKLEVGHPPGAPFFMILARFFSLFAGNPSNVAMTINILSALASAFTILFLFWTITHLARKIILKSEELTAGNLVGILGSGFIGAMVFTFSDTFWFSAVEGEVYASSSLFTAVVFWAIIKWENVADEKYANRWLVFIAYMMGLSVGIHLLNLLAIPAIVFVYYFRKYEVTRKGIVLASLISVTLLGIIMYGIIPGAVTMASVFELVFVNGLSMSYNIGVLIYIILLISGLVAGLYFTSRSGRKTTLNTVLFAGTLILLGVPLFFDGFLVVLSIAGVVVLSYFLAKHSEALVNTVLLCCTVILIGYSSFSMIVIRSLANPPMDENNPEDVFSLLAYLNREQYGDRPLFYGQYFNAPVDNRTPYKEGSPTYIRKNGEYVIATRKQIYNYLPEYCSVFPRMYSSQRQHVDDYIYWTGTKHSDFYEVLRDEEGNVRRDREGKILYDYSEPKKRPSMMNNLKFFFRYQVGFMYLRYFMWNFSGRQNDIQGHGNILHGNWLSGLKLIDDPRVGPQDTLPGDLANNKGKNIYFMFPLILGLIGLFFHWQSHRNDFLVVMLLFFMTGIAVVVYLNQYPHQPRERDYAYAGSFYAFAIWIGLGVMALYRMAKKISFKNYVIYGAGGFFALGLIGYVLGSKGFGGGMTYISIMMAALSIIVMFMGSVLKNNLIRAVLAILITLPCPYIMAVQNWDDHDRSGRYTALDFAGNYLNSCAPDAILFTNGDNDTFPLWYAQEVEGIRTDVRVVNLSLLNTDWYIDQMARKAYGSDPLPFSLTKDKYVQGTRDYLPVHERIKGWTDIKEVMQFIASDNEETRLKYPGSGETLDYIPAKNIMVPVDSAAVISNGTVKPENASKIEPFLKWALRKNYIMKSELMVFDIMATNNWKRPVYYAITVGNDSYLGLEKYFQLEGLAYRIVPIEDKNFDRYMLGRIDADIMYDNMMNKFKWGGVDDPRVYLDENNLRMTMNFRNNFARLADALLAEGKRDSAIAVLDKCVELMPDELVPYNYFNMAIAEVYFKAGEAEKGLDIMEKLAKNTEEQLNYFLSLAPDLMELTDDELTRSMSVYNRLMEVAKSFGQDELHQQLSEKFNAYYDRFLNTINMFER